MLTRATGVHGRSDLTCRFVRESSHILVGIAICLQWKSELRPFISREPSQFAVSYGVIQELRRVAGCETETKQFLRNEWL